eukprot:12206132-Prorocentrum_lima.AAC.1
MCFLDAVQKAYESSQSMLGNIADRGFRSDRSHRTAAPGRLANGRWSNVNLGGAALLSAR